MKTSFLQTALLTIITALCTSMLWAQNTSPYWSLAGSSNATINSKLGTTNDISLRFYTNNIQRMIINSAAGYVGIGTTTPLNVLTVKSTGSTPAGVWISGVNSPVFMGFAEGVSSEFVLAAANSAPTRRAVFQGRRSRGTLAAPEAVLVNDYLASMLASGYDGSTFQNPATLEFHVDGTPSPGNVPARISLVTGSNVTNRKERLRVGSTGDFNFNNNQLFLVQANATVGIGTNSPGAKFHVAGTGLFNDHLIVSDGGIEGRNSTGTAVFGTSTAEGGHGLRGHSGEQENRETPGTFGYGVYGSSNQGYGVYGISTLGTGVYGSGTEYGIYGTGEEYGIYGIGSSVGMYAKGGTGLRAEGSSFGIYSVGASGGGGGIGLMGLGYFGVVGNSENGYAVEGDSQNGFGGLFSSETGTGLLARTESGPYAGEFNGDIYTSGSYLPSDITLKEDIRNFGSAITIINKLRPKYYRYKDDSKYSSLHLPKGNHYGLIAQELEGILPDLIKESVHILEFENKSVAKLNFAGSEAPDLSAIGKQVVELQSAPKESVTIKAVNYTELIPIIIKGIQELNKKDEEIDQLRTEVEALRQMVLEMKNGHTGSGPLTSAFLEQNSPNPTNGTTIIRYQVPSNITSAKITITNVKGQLIKNITIGNNGTGQVSVNTSTLAAGTYNYTLWMEGKQVDTKRLIIAK